MKTRRYKVSDLKKIIMESANEFKPVMGKNVESDNKKINDKAYKDISKETESYDGGARNKSESKKLNYPNSDNRGMQDLEYVNMNPDFKKRVNSQMKGYVDDNAEKLHKNDEFGNSEFNEIGGMKERNKAFKKGRNAAREIGLSSRQIDKKEFENQTDGVFENKVVKLKFKNTVFVTEGHMLSKVPDDYKKEGKKFIMQDKNDTEYLVEWHNDDDPKVLNESKVNKDKDRIKELFNYKSSESNTTCKSRLHEENEIEDMLGKTRALMK